MELTGTSCRDVASHQNILPAWMNIDIGQRQALQFVSLIFIVQACRAPADMSNVLQDVYWQCVSSGRRPPVRTVRRPHGPDPSPENLFGGPRGVQLHLRLGELPTSRRGCGRKTKEASIRPFRLLRHWKCVDYASHLRRDRRVCAWGVGPLGKFDGIGGMSKVPFPWTQFVRRWPSPSSTGDFSCTQTWRPPALPLACNLCGPNPRVSSRGTLPGDCV